MNNKISVRKCAEYDLLKVYDAISEIDEVDLIFSLPKFKNHELVYFTERH
jgi:uncharacterized protein (DUF362 family)